MCGFPVSMGLQGDCVFLTISEPNLSIFSTTFPVTFPTSPNLRDRKIIDVADIVYMRNFGLGIYFRNENLVGYRGMGFISQQVPAGLQAAC